MAQTVQYWRTKWQKAALRVEELEAELARLREQVVQLDVDRAEALDELARLRAYVEAEAKDHQAHHVALGIAAVDDRDDVGDD